MRFPEWTRSGRRQPQLGDVACHADGPDGDPDELRRAYLVIGVEEMNRPGRGYRLVLERVAYGTLPASLDPDAIWTFYDLPRR
jgi:hypothetical protein